MDYYQHIRKYRAIFLIGFAVLFRFFFIFLETGGMHPFLHTFINGDDEIYMGFCENVFSKGEYVYNSDYTFRMPGMLFLYAPLRFFLSYQLALEAFLYIQIIFSGIATYYLAKATELLFKSRYVFYISFILNCFAFYMHSYTDLFYTESLAISCISIFLYAIVNFFEVHSKKYLLFAGFFAMWLIFLRPFLLPYFILICAILCIMYYKKAITISHIMVFIAPLSIAITIWTVRNYYKTQEFIPLQTSVNWLDSRPESYKKMRELIQVYGFRWEPWRENSHAGWLENVRWNKYRDDLFPQYMFDSILTLDTLKYARNKMLLHCDTTINELRCFDEEAVRVYQAFIDKEKSNFFQFLIKNRLRLVKSFGEPQISLTFQTIDNFFTKHIISFIELFFWFFIVIFGFIGILFYLFYYWKNYYPLIISFVPIFILVYFPLYSRVDEVRFSILAYPFLIIGASYLVLHFNQRYNNKRFSINSLIILLPLVLSMLH